MPITERRTFLKLALLAAPVIGTRVWSSPARGLSSEARKKRIVIVGGGPGGCKGRWNPGCERGGKLLTLCPECSAVEVALSISNARIPVIATIGICTA